MYWTEANNFHLGHYLSHLFKDFGNYTLNLYSLMNIYSFLVVVDCLMAVKILHVLEIAGAKEVA